MKTMAGGKPAKVQYLFGTLRIRSGEWLAGRSPLVAQQPVDFQCYGLVLRMMAKRADHQTLALRFLSVLQAVHL